jgi:NitT/TauT family transport system substrate-binding protein
VKIMLDWIVQSTHSPFFIAQEKGYFKNAGANVEAIDPGKGATNVAVSIASGVYQFGWIDLPTMIKFNTSNPTSPLVAVYISFDKTPLAVITRAAAGIRKPADMDQKRIIGSPGSAARATMPILLKAANAENIKINWLAVQPQLVGPMLRKGEADGSGGFHNSILPAALESGFKMEDLFVLRFADFGADLYGLALTTTKKFADENPETVRAVVAALNHGTKDMIADPDAALKLMQSKDPMMKPAIEKIRLDIALDLTDTPHVREKGLSSVTPEKLKFTIDNVAAAYEISPPPAESVYTDKYLPPLADRMLPKRK